MGGHFPKKEDHGARLSLAFPGIGRKIPVPFDKKPNASLAEKRGRRNSKRGRGALHAFGKEKKWKSFLLFLRVGLAFQPGPRKKEREYEFCGSCDVLKKESGQKVVILAKKNRGATHQLAKGGPARIRAHYVGTSSWGKTTGESRLLGGEVLNGSFGGEKKREVTLVAGRGRKPLPDKERKQN